MMSGNTDDVRDRPGDGDVRSPNAGPLVDDAAISQLHAASDVLLLGPMNGSIDDAMCTSVLNASPSPTKDLLMVSFTQPADERYTRLRTTLESMPERVCVVSGADEYGSETETPTGTGTTTLSVEVIRDPSDLPRLGITISKAIDRWEPENPPVLCFHSLTALLQYTRSKRVFRFIHLLQTRFDGRAHYHMDVDAHDRQIVATLRPLFDAIVEFDADGHLTVRS